MGCVESEQKKEYRSHRTPSQPFFIPPQISGTPRIHPLFLYAEKLGTHNGGKSKRAQRLAMDLGVAFLCRCVMPSQLPPVVSLRKG